MAKQKAIWNGVSEIYTHAVVSKIKGMPRQIGFAKSEQNAKEMRDKIKKFNAGAVEIIKRS